MTIKADIQKGTPLFRLLSEVEQLLVLLSQKERFVIEKRFNLDNTQYSTLEEIGQHFHVTRERVRQIEKNALQKLKRNIEKLQIFTINNLAYEELQKHGGIIREDLLLSAIIKDDESLSPSAILLILSLDRRFTHFGNTVQYAPHFRLADISMNLIDDVCNSAISTLKKKGDIMSLDQISLHIEGNLKLAPTYSTPTFFSIFQIRKSIKLMDEKVGLLEWRHIHPRTLRDKIRYVLEQKKEPLHFVDIANAITNAHFDNKSINLQAIHNELIRYNGFVLIGRGIYALDNWGYKHGTVADVICGLLKGGKSLSEEDIIKGVLKERKVKPITIVLNLKNKAQFVRVGRKHYSLKK